FEEFQRSVKDYKKFGVLLGVCSKNDESNALLGLNHPETVLTPDDFVSIKANWNPKDQNLMEMSSELSLLPESFVFVDDNPAECHIAESQIAGINTVNFKTVQEASYKLSRSGFFELTKLSSDDLKRNDMYIANAKRESQKKSFADYSEYLLSLDMNAVIEDFKLVYLQRITQLTNKSNQFNLTTKRYSDTDMQKVFESDRYIRLYGRLSDRFGDNGIVSVVIGEKNNDNLSIDLWLMSCRVLKREMEYAMLDTLVSECKKQNIRTITGYYFKTPKNNMVSELYKDFGFDLVKKFENGDSVWKLDISDYKNLNHAIKINESEYIQNG
ncbi:MAG: HAD-IIIC family phosphatase, partial [Ruminococcus sp.]